MNNTENILSRLNAGTLIRNAWTGRDAYGRETACLLAALAPECGRAKSAASCPAAVMPAWLAYLVPWMDDGGTTDAWPGMVRRFAAVAGRWHALTPEAWDMLHWRIRARCAIAAFRAENLDAEPLESLLAGPFCEEEFIPAFKAAVAAAETAAETESARAAARAAAKAASWANVAASSAEDADSLTATMLGELESACDAAAASEQAAALDARAAARAAAWTAALAKAWASSLAASEQPLGWALAWTASWANVAASRAARVDVADRLTATMLGELEAACDEAAVPGGPRQ